MGPYCLTIVWQPCAYLGIVSLLLSGASKYIPYFFFSIARAWQVAWDCSFWVLLSMHRRMGYDLLRKQKYDLIERQFLLWHPGVLGILHCLSLHDISVL